MTCEGVSIFIDPKIEWIVVSSFLIIFLIDDSATVIIGHHVHLE